MPEVHKPQPIRLGVIDQQDLYDPTGQFGPSGTRGTPGMLDSSYGPPGVSILVDQSEPGRWAPSSMSFYSPKVAQAEKTVPQERMPSGQMGTSLGQLHPQEPSSPFQKPRYYTPEPRMIPFRETTASQAVSPADRMRQTPEPRLPPGVDRTQAMSRATPEPRMVPGSGRSPPKERPPAGKLQSTQPRMPAGSLKSPPERMVPGQSKQPSARMTPGSQTRPYPGQANQ